jgi:thiol-disulfide isomerase/thioredoxin
MARKTRKGILFFSLLIFVLIAFWVNSGRGEEKVEAAKLGAVAPNFILEDLAGARVELKEVYRKNQLTMVNFWATWCPPCKQEIPDLVAFYRKHQGKGVELLAINVWDNSSRKQLQAFVASAQMEFPVLLDGEGETVNKYNIRAVPTTIFIDQSGQIKEIITGALTSHQLETRLQKYLFKEDS